MKHWIEQDGNNGPLVSLFCGRCLPCSPCIYRWIFDNSTIAENELIKTDDLSRFDITLYRNFSDPLADSGYGSLLLITNVQRDDLGIYECEVGINSVVISSRTTLLNIEDHLLPLYTTEKRIFSSAEIFQTTKSTCTNDAKSISVTFSIIGGSLGFLILTIVIILFIRRYYIKLEPYDEHITMTHPSSTNQSPYADAAYDSPSSDQQSADHQYTAYQRQPDPEPYAILNQTNVSPSSDQQYADHPYAAYQKQPDSEPYATLNQTNMSPSPDQQSSDHPYTAYQRQPDLEPYATLNQSNMSPSSNQQSSDHPYTAYKQQPEPEPLLHSTKHLYQIWQLLIPILIITIHMTMRLAFSQSKWNVIETSHLSILLN